MLLADVSHELMTPLTAMRAYREVLAMSDVARDPETAHCLDVIADETERLERLVGDLLDLARLEAGGDSLMPRRRRGGESFWPRRGAPRAGRAD